MSFENEMEDVKKAESSANYIDKPSVEDVIIKKYEMSPKDLKGCPYIEFVFETLDDRKAVNKTRLYRVRDTDNPDVAEFKKKRIKDLLENAGANFSLKGEAVIKSAVDKKVKALFKEVEYIGYDKNNNNKPEIKTKIEYSFSSNINTEIKGNQSYFRNSLKEKDLKKLEGELLKWNNDNKQVEKSNVSISEESYGNVDDDLGF